MKTKKIVIMGLFIALSFIGANLKIMGTVAFDSMPAFLGSLILGPVMGAIIGAVGHFLTALTSGFPLGLPIHIIIMVCMAVTMALFAVVFNKLKNKNEYLAIIFSTIVASAVNGPITVFLVVPLIGKGVIAMIPVLTLASVANIVVALLIYKFIPNQVLNNI